MQSQLAAPLRGWQVSALAFLKALGNQIEGPTHTTNARARAHTHTHIPKPRSSSCPDTPCLGFRIRGTENPSEGEPGWGRTSQVLPRPPLLLFQSLSPHMVSPRRSPPPVLELQLRTRFRAPQVQALPPKSTDQLSPPSPVPSLNSPKKGHFLPAQKTFSSFCNAIRHETQSAATATRFAQRRAGGGRPYLAAALQVAVPRRSSAIPRSAGGARSTVRWSPPAQRSGRECPRTERPSPGPPFGSSLVFPEEPSPPRRTDEERGDSGWHRLAPRCALPGPRALCPRAAAAARHMPPPGSGRGTCPRGSAPGSALPPPRLGLPARSSPFSSRPFSLYLPLHFFPCRLLLPVPSFIVVSFSTSRRQALQVGGLPSSLTLPLPGGGGRGYCWPLLLPFLPHAGPPPPPRAASWCNAQAAWVRPKPASLLSMPNCPAGVALDSRVLAPLRRLRLAWGGEGGGVGGESAQLWRSPAFSPGGLPGDGRLTHPARPHTVS